MFVKLASTGQIKFNFDKFCSKLKGSSFAVNRASTRKQEKTMGNMGFFATKMGHIWEKFAISLSQCNMQATLIR